MKKKLLIVTLVFIMVLTIIACDNKIDEKDPILPVVEQSKEESVYFEGEYELDLSTVSTNWPPFRRIVFFLDGKCYTYDQSKDDEESSIHEGYSDYSRSKSMGYVAVGSDTKMAAIFTISDDATTLTKSDGAVYHKVR